MIRLILGAEVLTQYLLTNHLQCALKLDALKSILLKILIIMVIVAILNKVRVFITNCANQHEVLKQMKGASWFMVWDGQVFETAWTPRFIFGW